MKPREVIGIGVILALALIVASLLVERQTTRHDPYDCFFAVYDNLAANGTVYVNETGAWSVTWKDSGKAQAWGFTRTKDIRELKAGDKMVITLDPLPPTAQEPAP
jgi:hypothetical protein